MHIYSKIVCIIAAAGTFVTTQAMDKNAPEHSIDPAITTIWLAHISKDKPALQKSNMRPYVIRTPREPQSPSSLKKIVAATIHKPQGSFTVTDAEHMNAADKEKFFGNEPKAVCLIAREISK